MPFGLGSHYHRDAGSGLERWPEGLCEGEHSSAKSASSWRTHLVKGTINRKDLVPCWWRPAQGCMGDHGAVGDTAGLGPG